MLLGNSIKFIGFIVGFLHCHLIKLVGIFSCKDISRYISLSTIWSNTLHEYTFCNFDEFEVILCAGHYLKDENAFYREFVLNTLEQLHVQIVFIFVSAISLKGIYDLRKDLLQVQKKMIAVADKTVVFADSSKLEKTGLLKLCNLHKDYVYVTDIEISEDI